MQLWSLLEADLRPPPLKNRYSRSQQKNKKWLGRTDLVIFDVFKRLYWRHLPQNLTKGIGVSLRSPLLLLLHAQQTRHIVPSVAFGDIIGAILCDFLYHSLNFWSSRDYQGFREVARVPKSRSRQRYL
jgi:hypothetical protein